jgi:ubiquinone/menaquinone biosynthesis C-methylase UbiE
MSETQYVFSKSQFESERDRLQLLERICDRATHQRLLATGLTAGWHCLEVGVGAGSILQWLSGVVGESGKAIGIDIDTRFVRDIALPNVETIEADIRQFGWPEASFDLIHARNVLVHLADYPIALAKMLALLKPGGWLAIEEPDFSAARPIIASDEECQAMNNINRAIFKMFADRDMDYALGIKLPSILQTLGLQQLTVENDVPLSNGGSDVATMMKRSAIQLADSYIATGAATRDDIQQYCQLAENPTTWAVYLATVSVRGQKS